mmetsp:Transcript_18338/g.26880  ORF Transcript_18338/g.26880 Transcript_18338/m.26880 type:complete len:267 (+) Transcript_18338:513-1313(+)
MRSVRELGERGHTSLQVAHQLLLEHAHLNIIGVDHHVDAPILELAEHGQEGSTRRGSRRSSDAEAFALLIVFTQSHVWGDPENIALFAAGDGRVRHRGLEPRAAARDGARQRRDVKGRHGTLGIKIVGERPADLVAAGTDEVDGGLRRKAVHAEHMRHVVNEDRFGHRPGEVPLQRPDVRMQVARSRQGPRRVAAIVALARRGVLGRHWNPLRTAWPGWVDPLLGRNPDWPRAARPGKVLALQWLHRHHGVVCCCCDAELHLVPCL